MDHQLFKLEMVSDRKIIEVSRLRLSRIEPFVVLNAKRLEKEKLTHEFEYNSHIQHTLVLKVSVHELFVYQGRRFVNVFKTSLSCLNSLFFSRVNLNGYML